MTPTIKSPRSQLMTMLGRYLPITALLSVVGLSAAAGASFLLPQVSVAKAPIVIGADPDISISTNLAPSERLREADRFLRSEVAAISSKELLQRATEAASETGNYTSRAVQRFGTDIVDLSVSGPTPKGAGKVMSSLIGIYSDERVEQYSRRTAVSIARIDARIRQLRELAGDSVTGAGDWEAFTSELTALSSTRASLGLRSVQKQDLVRVVDKTDFAGKTGTRLRPNLLVLGTLTGLLAGLAIAVARQRLRNDVTADASTAEELSGVPVLGTFNGSSRPINAARSGAVVPRAGVARTVCEEGRSLTNLLSALDVNRVMVAGVTNGGAASFVADELIAAAAETGRMGVLLDVTGRSSRRKDFDLNDLSTELDRAIDTLCTLARAAADRGDGLVIVNGTKANPEDLPRSAESFLDRVERDRGLVVLDSEPVQTVGASLRWARETELLVAIDPENTSRSDLESALSTLRLVGARVLGVVIVHQSDRGSSSLRIVTATSATSAAPAVSTPELDASSDEATAASIRI
jgi:hypothetical protein